MTNYRQTMADALELMYLMREYKLMERELTDTEKKKREEIAQDMDDGDFKDRYGDRWKEVKMAVATKAAKGEKMEGFDLDEATKWKMGDGRPRGAAHIENIKYWDLPKDQLQYIIKDAGEAYKLNPTARKATKGPGNSRKATKGPGNWADQVNDATTVLGWRKKKGIKEDVDLDEVKKGTKWEYEDATGVKRIGVLDKFSDKGGTDITYFFKRVKDGKLDVVSGSRLKKAKIVREEAELDEASAGADARRAMSRDKDLGRGKDSADIDDLATFSANFSLSLGFLKELNFV